jgi:hypothetical protein
MMNHALLNRLHDNFTISNEWMSADQRTAFTRLLWLASDIDGSTLPDDLNWIYANMSWSRRLQRRTFNRVVVPILERFYFRNAEGRLEPREPDPEARRIVRRQYREARRAGREARVEQQRETIQLPTTTQCLATHGCLPN